MGSEQRGRLLTNLLLEWEKLTDGVHPKDDALR